MTIKSPRILFVCVENSCRSQIAEGFARTISQEAIEIWSAGSKPAGEISRMAIDLMREKGINLAAQHSKALTDLPAGQWDYVVTMGCGDQCPHLQARKMIDWNIPDPKGLPIDEFRKVRDTIEVKVRALIGSVSRNKL